MSNTLEIDEITWNDLDMERIISKIDKAESSVGSEYIKQAFRNPLYSIDELRLRSRKAEYFMDHENAVKRLSKIFHSLGRTKKVSFLDFIFKLKDVPERSNIKHIILVILLILSVVLIFVQPAIGIIAFVIMIAVNIIVYFKTKAGIEGYFICLKYLVSMVVCAKTILSANVLDKEIFAEDIRHLEESVKIFAGLKRGSWLITNSVSGSLVDVIMDYIRMIFHVDLMKFNSMRNTAVKNEEQIRILFKTLGELELAMSTAAFRKGADYYCEPKFYNSTEKMQNDRLTLIAEEVYHPLVEHPVANTIRTEGSVLLTGSNASGKSTFLKTIAVNQLFAQTLYTCLARQFMTSFFHVMSSMALTDNLLGNESYFVVEIKSLKRIFDALGQMPVLCFIDEVLRGTNTIERIAASSRLLAELADSNALVFAATHDIELTGLLNEQMNNYHFSESVEGGQVQFDYLLKPGAANTSNAIKLLDAFGFDKRIVQDADARAERFRASGTWK